jgi:hypothetical protein
MPSRATAATRTPPRCVHRPLDVAGSANLVDLVTDPPSRQVHLPHSHSHNLVQPGMGRWVRMRHCSLLVKHRADALDFTHSAVPCRRGTRHRGLALRMTPMRRGTAVSRRSRPIADAWMLLCQRSTASVSPCGQGRPFLPATRAGADRTTGTQSTADCQARSIPFSDTQGSRAGRWLGGSVAAVAR